MKWGEIPSKSISEAIFRLMYRFGDAADEVVGGINQNSEFLEQLVESTLALLYQDNKGKAPLNFLFFPKQVGEVACSDRMGSYFSADNRADAEERVSGGSPGGILYQRIFTVPDRNDNKD